MACQNVISPNQAEPEGLVVVNVPAEICDIQIIAAALKKYGPIKTIEARA
jgi:hypothetical protein